MPKQTIDDLNLNGRRVLVRVDFNVPLKETTPGVWTVTDETRIREALPTIRKILSDGGIAVLLSHLGRPKGKPEVKYSLQPVSVKLGEMLGRPVRFVNETVGDEAARAIGEAAPGDVILLQNTRFQAGEEQNDEALSRQLAALGDVYVNDAFGSAHRAHASTEGITRFIGTSALGYLMKKEVDYLTRALEAPERPFVAVLGGAKVSDKIGVIEALVKKVDLLLIGGAMSYTFLKAFDQPVGGSKVEEDRLGEARRLFELAEGKLRLPTDHVVAPAFDNDAPRQTVVGGVPEGMMALDIGPETVEKYREHLLGARTIIWNGPMGVFEMPNFAHGTISVARTLAEATDRGALTIVGGGDSVAAITQAGFQDRVSHVSTGGGAMLEFLEGISLPGVAAIPDR